jgi:hypothetical protein
MWAGADILLQTLRTSRWNERWQTIAIQQQAGYIRYDLHDDPDYTRFDFDVNIGSTRIALTPGGSYSVEIIPTERRMHFSAGTERLPVTIDVAVRTGHATVHSQGHATPLAAGQRLVIDPGGVPREPQPALWQLVQDGNFETYSEEEYNNTTLTNQPTLPSSDTWQVGTSPVNETSGRQGVFQLAYECQPPALPGTCDPDNLLTSAWFFRSGGQTKNFTTGVLQHFGRDGQGVDISEYRSLTFSLWMRISHQLPKLTGDQGSECPVMVRFLTKANNPTDAEEERVICFYINDDPSQTPEQDSAITYYQVPRDEWHYFEIDLRAEEWLPHARYLWYLSIYANGHEYDSRVTGVSLIGSHYANDTIPIQLQPQILSREAAP